MGLAFQGVAVGFAGRLGLLASGRLGGAMKSNSPRCIMLEVTGRICGTWLSEEEDETEISVAARAGLSLCFPSVYNTSMSVSLRLCFFSCISQTNNRSTKI